MGKGSREPMLRNAAVLLVFMFPWATCKRSLETGIMTQRNKQAVGCSLLATKRVDRNTLASRP
jgi:hypothetical protein